MNAGRIERHLREFSSEDPKDAFDFITKSYFGTLAPIQIPQEFLSLLEIVKKKKPNVVMEIGTAKGGALFCFARMAADDATIVSVDLMDGELGGGFSAGYPTWKVPIYQAFAKKGQTMSLVRQDSHSEETLGKVKGILDGKQVDFLFIDGDHTYEGVKKDFEMYSPLVRKGGVVAFHDVAPHASDESCGGVKYFWKEIKNYYPFREFIQDINQEGCGVGVLFL